MKQKVAIIRGANLNKWELQNYEPLMDRFEITAYATNRNRYEISGINVPVVQIEAHPSHPDIYAEGFEDMLANYDIIFSADITWFYSLQAILAKEKYGCRVVCLEWENIPFAYEDIEFIKQLKQIVRSGADRFIAVSEMAKYALSLEGVNEDIIDVVHMGVDLERFNPYFKKDSPSVRREFGINGSDTVILYTGRLVWEKGIYDLLNAFADLMRDLKNGVKLIFVGDGPESGVLKQRASELGISENIIFSNNISYDRMHLIYCMSDIFILPSIPTRKWQEQFGMALVEAMACGVSVITTYSGALPEIAGEAGTLVQPGDCRELSRAMRALLVDPDLRKVKGMHSRIRAEEKFDTRKTSSSVASVFERLMSTLHSSA